MRQHIRDLGVNGGRAAPHGVCDGRLLPSVAASLKFQTASGKAPWCQPGGQEARSWIAATEETEINRIKRRHNFKKTSDDLPRMAQHLSALLITLRCDGKMK